MIVSTQFLQEVVHLINFDYFQNSYIRKVARWCTEYFDQYEVAPFDDITNIFRTKQVELKEEDVDLVEKLLVNISTRYTFNTGINVLYQVDQALVFFKKRELEITNSNIKILLDKNDIDGAEDQINNFAKISKISSGWIDPLDDKHVDELFQNQDRMFSLSGTLGRFIGGMDHSWLVAVISGFKVGKTFSLQEITIAAIQQRLKVASFALEMEAKQSNDRFYKRLLGAGDPEGGPSLYPCFDCKSNQDGSCKKQERTNRVPLLVSGDVPPFNPKINYKPCTACRHTNPKDFIMITWYELLDRPAYTSAAIKRQLKALRKAFPDFYRFKQYPKFSASLSDIKRDLDILERTDGFIQHIIIIDQANGVKPETGISLDGTAPHAHVWRGMASLAGERRALVISPSQVNRGGLDKKSITANDIAQHVALLGDVDLAYVLNQTEEEKRRGLMRYSVMLHRHDDFDPAAYCNVLQKLRYGQVYLDAYITGKQGESSESIYTL